MIKKTWLSFFKKGHERSIRAKKNVFYSLILKGLSVSIGFAFIPISLSYLGRVEFGIFLTLASIIDWFSELDVGIGSGLRNKLGESIANDDQEKARTYVSTAYYFLASIFGSVFLLFTGICFFLPWADWLQTDPSLQSDIALLAVFMLAALAIRFVSSLIYEIFYALQDSIRVNFFELLSKAAFLIILLLLIYTTEKSLVLFGAAKTMTFALVPFAAGFYYFRTQYKHFKPSLKFADRKYLKVLFSIGIQFFVIKLAMLVIHKTNTFLIAGYIGPEAVPEYEVSFKYLSIFLIFYLILTNQLWAANIEAYQKKEFAWMRSNMVEMLKIWLGTSFLSIIMVLISPWVFELWLGDKLNIPMPLTIAVALSIVLTTWVNLFNLVLNGTGKIRLQMYLWLLGCIFNIPVSIYLAIELGMGTIGIVLGTVLCLIPLAILSPLQVWKILQQKDIGIWSQ